jgi:hypothetical protein
MTINVNEALDRVKNSIYGKDIRQAIIDSITAAYNDATAADNASMEVSQARGLYASLLARLQALDTADSNNAKAITNIGNSSPKGVYATLSALQTAFPTGTTGVYLVTADGKWYYWSGSAWTAGGTYQGTGISDGSLTRAMLEQGIRDKIVNLTQQANNVIMYNGVISSSTVMVNSNTVEVTTNTTYGTVGFNVPNKKDRKFKVFTTIKNIGTVDATTVRMVTGYNNSLATTSGVGLNGVQIGNTIATLAVGATVDLTSDFTSVQDASAYAGIALTVITSTSGAVLRVTQRIYDVTLLPVSSAVDWTNPPQYLLLAETSKQADTAVVATTANYASDGPFVKPIQQYQNVNGDWNNEPSSQLFANGITGMTFVNGLYSGTPNVSYGALLAYTTQDAVKYAVGKKYRLTALVKADAATKIQASFYQYNGSTQLKLYPGPNVNVGTDWVRISWVVTLDQPTVNKLLLGYTHANGTTYVKFYVKDLMLIDETGLTALDDTSIVNNGGYWTQYPNLAASATSSLYANTAGYANDGPFAKLALSYKNLSGDWYAKTTSDFGNVAIASFALASGVASGIPNQTYGAIYVNNTNGVAEGKTMLFTFLAKADSAMKAYPNCYNYDAQGTNLGNVGAATVDIGTDWVRVTQIYTLNKTGVAKVQQGLINANGANYVKFYIKDYMMIDVTGITAPSDADIDGLGSYWAQYPNIVPAAQTALIANTALDSGSVWKDKKVLVMGDSLTAALKWQAKVGSIHKCNITTHAKGGIGIRSVVDGSAPELGPLTTTDVGDKDLIILFIGMNERATPYGVQGDLAPAQNTIWGNMQYAINTIYDLLTASNNLDCKLLVVTPHCAGKYPYVDVDGYGEYPAGTGQTLEKLSNTLSNITIFQ